MLKYLSGKKTYAVATVFAIVAFCESMGWLTSEQARAAEGILVAAGFATVRSAIAKGAATLVLFTVLGGSPAMAQGPSQPQRMVPWRDYVVPAQHWRKQEVWTQHWSLLGGPYWRRQVVWMPLYPEQGP